MTMFDTDLGARGDFDERVIEFGDFAPDVALESWAVPFRPGDVVGPIFWRSIDTVSPVEPVGQGRTKTTLIRPTIVQTDAQTPYAGFDRRESPNRNPAVSVHFEPAAYGATGPGTYVCTFLVEAFAPSTMQVSGYAAGGTVVGGGSRSVQGRTRLTVTLRDLPVYGGWVAIEQTAGESWSWYSTSISHPPLVITL